MNEVFNNKQHQQLLQFMLERCFFHGLETMIIVVGP